MSPPRRHINLVHNFAIEEDANLEPIEVLHRVRSLRHFRRCESDRLRLSYLPTNERDWDGWRHLHEMVNHSRLDSAAISNRYVIFTAEVPFMLRYWLQRVSLEEVHEQILEFLHRRWRQDPSAVEEKIFGGIRERIRQQRSNVRLITLFDEETHQHEVSERPEEWGLVDGNPFDIEVQLLGVTFKKWRQRIERSEPICETGYHPSDREKHANLSWTELYSRARGVGYRSHLKARYR